MENADLEKKAVTPKKIDIDGQIVENHSLSDIADFDRYIESKKALKRKSSGIKFAKFEASGAL